MGLWNEIFSSKSKKSNRKNPEDYFETEITESYVKVTHPERKDEQIDWKEIEEIQLINTDEGPFLPDVWLILTGNGKGISIPQGSEGWIKVYDIVSKYDGFNFENVIKSASCTENKTFDIWKK
ncbi:hypothetical protein [Christiangramia sabulilitoris]|uniref:Uncharacterized protein n=1 Tax=Christiangramia sabulilitoris TaxID=2583991 RepID=A0A550I750_9FLAO|nr:hypothetical protein [Christiangramia sabulilitoris]TRO66803.1 hypothetical protein FGM01_02615 [Christiangramia sabulilitoris]